MAVLSTRRPPLDSRRTFLVIEEDLSPGEFEDERTAIGFPAGLRCIERIELTVDGNCVALTM